MKPTPVHYIIFVRPPGSLTWTLHMRGLGPWRDGRIEEANQTAITIATQLKYCAVVVPVKLPQELDSELYAIMGDGDIQWKPTA